MKPITLSKSRFAVALECPRQLDYARDKSYYDARTGNEFLESLAEGGQQVGELARRMFPGGRLIDDLSSDTQAKRTAELLALPKVTLFEATIRHANLLVRTDILEKNGNQVSLIEVKAKGINPNEDTFLTDKGARPVRSKWLPYLLDVAYQTYVLKAACPQFKITPYLMLVDKTVAASVDRINPMLAVDVVGRQVTVTVSDDFDVTKIDPPILRRFNVTEEVAQLLQLPREVLGVPRSFEKFVEWASGILGKGESFPVNVGSHCKHCSYYVDPDEVTADKKSGWARCMQEHTGAAALAPRAETVFGLHRASDNVVGTLLHKEHLMLASLPESDLGEGNVLPDAITFDQRRQLQVAEAHGEVEAPVLLKEPLRAAIEEWRWPLHFIDFETSRPALPYHRGRTPYDQILFQFSHHVLERDGRLAHRTQCLIATPHVPPSARVVRALRDALSNDGGTVVHWWTHEATVLSDIRRQIIELDGEADARELVQFIDSLVGTRDRTGRLSDLGILVSRTVFYPGTAGSSSIKKILPAALRHSEVTRGRYAAPVYGTDEIPSLNFRAWQWVREDDNGIVDPYSLLNPLFVDSTLQEIIGAAESSENGATPSFIANGGAAIIAFDQLQRTQLPPAERARIETELLRYCELDTLAMVMIYQALTECRIGTEPEGEL